MPGSRGFSAPTWQPASLRGVRPASLLSSHRLAGALIRTPVPAEEEEPQEGVERLGSCLSDVPEGRRFDAIVCSHVLEHLADPCEVLLALREHLASTGVLYVEVPLEIWLEPPLQPEPVTHVNFFAPQTLRFLLERAGFRVLQVRVRAYRHPKGHRSTAIKALGIPGAVRTAPPISPISCSISVCPDCRSSAVRWCWPRPPRSSAGERPTSRSRPNRRDSRHRRRAR